MELFADDGATVMTDIFPSESFDRLALHAEGGKATVLGGEVTRLESIW